MHTDSVSTLDHDDADSFDDSLEVFDFAADVIVVGAGSAGFAAAVTAAKAGASVILLERAEYTGGTTALSGGSAWIPNNSSMRAAGLEDQRDDALRFLCRLAYPQFYDAAHPTLGLAVDQYELLAAFYDRGPEAIDHLTDIGALDLTADVGEEAKYGITFTDYGGHLPENRSPVGRHLAPDLNGPTMIERFQGAAEALGVEIKLGHRVVGVVQNEQGEVAALEVHTGVRTVIARARKGVIFGSGGFGQNDELRRRHLPGRIFGSCAIPTAVGDFVQISEALGASLANLDRAWWKQVAVEPALRHPTPPSLWMPHGDSMIQVDRNGRRVVNEKAPYNERGQIHLAYNPTTRDHPNAVLFMIWDDAVARNTAFSPFRDPVPLPGKEVDYVIEAATLAELKARIDDRLEALRSETGGLILDGDFVANLELTIDRFNGFAVAGVDDDFGRGGTDFERGWALGNRDGLANPTMAPLADEGPYYCMIVGAGVLDTNGGPRINTSAQVLDSAGQPIPGLYGAGNCVATPAGRAYWGPGATIGLAITFGYIAALNLVEEPDKPAPE